MIRKIPYLVLDQNFIRLLKLPFILFFFLGIFPILTADETPDIGGINANFRNPSFSEGILTTDCGGIITGPDFQIQAQHITYIRKNADGLPIHRIEAEGNLAMEFCGTLFVGDKLEYDFLEKYGVIQKGRTQVGPWYFGGDQIQLCSDGSYIICHAFATTSEKLYGEWQVKAETISLSNTKHLSAKNLQLKVFEIPFLWVPSIKLNLETFGNSPFSYYLRWGGHQGPRFGIAYQLLDRELWKAAVRFDYRIRRGPGGGIESHYKSSDFKTTYDAINYFACDSAVEHPSEKYRYRFQGIYHTQLLEDKVAVDLSYDKLSDKEMATDYNDHGLELDTAGRTQLVFRRQEKNWITNLLTRMRVNNFQTIKQELPTWETSWRPLEFGNTGIVANNLIRASYLNFEYANYLIHVHDYSSTRLELSPSFYKSFHLNNINFIPELAATGIYYGNSPQEVERWLGLGKISCELNTNFYRRYASNYKHILTPYASYDYFTYPSVSPNDHYIFDIEDGWYRLNTLRIGVRQSIFQKKSPEGINRIMSADIYSNAFFHTKTMPTSVPKVYTKFIYRPLETVLHSIEFSWDFRNIRVDHINFRCDWTLNYNTALSVEYRHRSPYDWRKVDYNNYILESFRSQQELYHSQVSDRRDTLLVHLFYRFHPDWALEFESRQGWNRRFEPYYNEFEIDFLATLQSAWNVKFSYQHKEDDDRVAVYFSLAKKRPEGPPSCSMVPLLEF